MVVSSTSAIIFVFLSLILLINFYSWNYKGWNECKKIKNVQECNKSSTKDVSEILSKNLNLRYQLFGILNWYMVKE